MDDYYDQGYAAFGLGRDKCPYQAQTAEAAQWEEGWYAAQDDHNNNADEGPY